MDSLSLSLSPSLNPITGTISTVGSHTITTTTSFTLVAHHHQSTNYPLSVLRFILSLHTGFTRPAAGTKPLISLSRSINGRACLLSLINAKLLPLPAKEMKGCRGLIFSTLIRNVSYSFAAVTLQLLLFSYISGQALGGKPAVTILLPSSAGRNGGDGTSYIKMRDTNQYNKEEEEEQQNYNEPAMNVVHGRGLIAGALGSTPPKCVAKCSRCTPCKAVRVPIQPGRTKVSLMEYYPEAWRCQCKNKLYMP